MQYRSKAKEKASKMSKVFPPLLQNQARFEASGREGQENHVNNGDEKAKGRRLWETRTTSTFSNI
jgi:hypothetical protein